MMNQRDVLILISAILGASIIAVLLVFLIVHFHLRSKGYISSNILENLGLKWDKPVLASSVDVYRKSKDIDRLPSFQIPGHFIRAPSPVQPVLAPDSDSSDSQTSVWSEDDFDGDGEPYASLIWNSQLEGVVDRTLYPADRRETVGCGTLGKIRFSLSYQDASRRILRLSIHKVEKLQFSAKNIMNMYISIHILPDRRRPKKSQVHPAIPSCIFEELFYFTLYSREYGFELKTLRFDIHYIDKADKDFIYGEARIPLLSREIYKQVETVISLNINPSLSQNEVGDILIELSYSTEHQSLALTITKIKFLTQKSTENFSEIHFRCFLKHDQHHIGQRHVFHVQIIEKGFFFNADIHQQRFFKLPKEEFRDSTLKLHITGRQKSVLSYVNIGKVTMGNKSKDESGLVHWQTVDQSPDLPWPLWHTIYG